MTEKTIKELIHAHHLLTDLEADFHHFIGEPFERFSEPIGKIEHALTREVWIPKTGLDFDDESDFIGDTESMIFNQGRSEKQIYKILTTGKMLIKNIEDWDYEEEFEKYGEAIRGTELRPWCDEE